MLLDFNNWGCEFLDFGEPQPPLEQSKAIELPISILSKCVDPAKRIECEVKDAVQMNELSAFISQHGIPGVGELVFATNGVILSDGNHRLIAAENLREEKFAVNIRHSTNPIRTGGAKYYEIIEELLEYIIPI